MPCFCIVSNQSYYTVISLLGALKLKNSQTRYYNEFRTNKTKLEIQIKKKKHLKLPLRFWTIEHQFNAH